MSWKVTCVVDERERFVLRALEPGSSISVLCREFGISRKTGYKWVKRFLQSGRSGLANLSRRPSTCPTGVSGEVVGEVVRLRVFHPTWGAKKLRRLLVRSGRWNEVPSVSSIEPILRHCNLIAPARRRRKRSCLPSIADRVTPAAPNDLWTIDYKGWWRTKDGSRCEPLARTSHQIS